MVVLGLCFLSYRLAFHNVPTKQMLEISTTTKLIVEMTRDDERKPPAVLITVRSFGIPEASMKQTDDLIEFVNN